MSHKPDPVEALHGALLANALGIAGGARAIGRSPQVLYNKFSESMPNNELTGREERALADAVGGEAYVQAVCAYFGGVFLRLPDGMAGDDDLFEDYLGIIREMGDLSREFIAAKADGAVDADEFNRLRREAYEVVAAIHRFITDLETCVVKIPAAVPLRRAGTR